MPSIKVGRIAYSPAIAVLQSKEQDQTLTKLSKASRTTLEVVKILTPILMSTVMDMQTGSFMCIVTQSYSKLLIFTHFNFVLEESQNSRFYYGVFQEMLDKLNDVVMTTIVGQQAVYSNRKYVC